MVPTHRSPLLSQNEVRRSISTQGFAGGKFATLIFGSGEKNICKRRERDHLRWFPLAISTFNFVGWSS